MDFCQCQNERLFFVGAAPATLDKALKALHALYPKAQIEGYSPPIAPYPFADPINREILEKIEEFRPHHVVVCFGPLKQERWIRDNAAALTEFGVRRAYGFGGTIDFVASTQRRAPRILQNIGLEWLFRAVFEPRKRLRRTLTMFRMPYYMAMTKRAIREVGTADPWTQSPRRPLAVVIYIDYLAMCRIGLRKTSVQRNRRDSACGTL